MPHPGTLMLLFLACNPQAAPDPVAEEIIADAGPDLEVPVGTEVILDARASVGDTIAWDAGDGTQLSGITVRHTYTAPGNFTAIVSVIGAGGLRRTDTARVTAYLPATTPAPSASSPIAVDADRREVWVAVPEANHVSITALDTGATTWLPLCASPRTVAWTPGTMAVVCEGDDRMLLMDTTSRAVVKEWGVRVGSRPYGVVGRGTSWWMTHQADGVVTAIDDPEVTTSSPGEGVRALAVDGSGRWYASRFRSGRDRGEIYTSQGTIYLQRDPGPDSDTQNRGVPTVLRAMAISPDGGTLYVGGHVANNERGLYRDGEALTSGMTLRATLRVVDTATSTELLERRKVFDNQGEVSAIALSPRGNWIWVAHPGTGTILRLDAYSLQIAGSIPDGGAGIDGLSVTPDGGTLLVHAWLDRELHAWDLTDLSHPALRWTAPTVDVEPLAPQVLGGKRLFHDAADPRLARDGYLSCSACHPDGRDDGVVWDFTQRGEGLRNTVSLEGRAGLGMGRVHWSGNFDEIQDFEVDIRNAQGGTGLLTEADWAAAADPLGPPKAGRSADLDALAAYVSSLDQAPISPWPGASQGETLFFVKGCDDCHIPALGFTDSTLAEPVRHDVGTLTAASGKRSGGALDGLDTPTLLGVFATAPYLHDGSAPSLEAAIGAHDVPGLSLSSEDKVYLAAWVRSL